MAKSNSFIGVVCSWLREPEQLCGPQHATTQLVLWGWFCSCGLNWVTH